MKRPPLPASTRTSVPRRLFPSQVSRRALLRRGQATMPVYLPEPDEELPDSELSDGERRQAMERERWRREGRRR